MSHRAGFATIPGMELSAEATRRFETLVLQHQVRLRVFVRSLGVDADWVDDVAQEACLIAFRQWDSFDQSRDFGKWVRGIAANIVRNDLRKDARRQRLMHSELADILLKRQEGANVRPAAPGRTDEGRCHWRLHCGTWADQSEGGRGSLSRGPAGAGVGRTVRHDGLKHSADVGSYSSPIETMRGTSTVEGGIA